MKALVVFSCLVVCAFAKPGLVSVAGLHAVTYNSLGLPVVATAPVIAAPAPVVTTSVVSPVVGATKTQYHAQDVLGQAAYGHSEPLQTHNAIQDAAGNKIGSFSYVAPTGEVLTTSYVADALGYRAASNALPVGPAAPVVDTPEVVAARVAHLDAVAKSRSKRGIAPVVVPASTILAAPVAYSAPAIVAPAVVAHVPAATSVTRVINAPDHVVTYSSLH